MGSDSLARLGESTYRMAIMALLITGLCSSLGFAGDKPGAATISQLKVAYTVSFFKFLSCRVGTGDQAPDCVRLYVLADSKSLQKAFGEVDGLELQLGGMKTLEVKTLLTELLNGDEFQGRQAVYIDHANRRQIRRISEQLRGKRVLLITESKGALGDGSMLNLVRVGTRLRWEMSRKALEAESLVMSAQVYRNALSVE
jgi:hypothetical protein